MFGACFSPNKQLSKHRDQALLTHCCPAPSSGPGTQQVPNSKWKNSGKALLSALVPPSCFTWKFWEQERNWASLDLGAWTQGDFITLGRLLHLLSSWDLGGRQRFPPSIQAHAATFFSSLLASAWGREPSGELIDQKPQTFCCHLNYIWFILQTSYQAGAPAFKQTHIRITPKIKSIHFF